MPLILFDLIGNLYKKNIYWFTSIVSALLFALSIAKSTYLHIASITKSFCLNKFSLFIDS